MLPVLPVVELLMSSSESPLFIYYLIFSAFFPLFNCSFLTILLLFSILPVLLYSAKFCSVLPSSASSLFIYVLVIGESWQPVLCLPAYLPRCKLSPINENVKQQKDEVLLNPTPSCSHIPCSSHSSIILGCRGILLLMLMLRNTIHPPLSHQLLLVQPQGPLLACATSQ